MTDDHLLAPGHLGGVAGLGGGEAGESHLVPLAHLQLLAGALLLLLSAAPDVDGLDESLRLVPHHEAALVPPGVTGPGRGYPQLQPSLGDGNLSPGLIVLKWNTLTTTVL